MKRIVYGINPVREALKSSLSQKKGNKGKELSELLVLKSRSDSLLQEILILAKKKRITPKLVTKGVLDGAAGATSHQGVLLTFKGGFEYLDIEDLLEKWRASKKKSALFVVLDCIQDPQNAGSLIRASLGAGADGLIIAKDRAAGVTPVVEKASAGASEILPIARVTNIALTLKRLKEAGLWTVALEGGSKTSIYQTDMKGNIALVIGSEGSGIRRLVKKECDIVASIPINKKLESLNAAQAGTIALFEACRQRGK
ncbi:MAG: 23S rRNA (guanosine(2251)-2'-O)-methyltransferase RlmB [Deltaproteobacteria bacterium]|nr:23S rRNA (guanosine(2251)-2'-O)-methyltransferase RlmB [Deltaproteobacteria bacterium]